MEDLIIPNTYVGDIATPLIFLAGPIRSAPNWQDEAVRILFSQERDLTIASPRRGVREGIAPFVVEGDATRFGRQRAWERHYLEIAARTGAIMFWLPGESEHNCQKPYGAMTRLEIGQWLTRYSFDNSVRFCMGCDGKFPEMRTIEFDLEMDAPGKRIFPTLERTCAEAVRLAYQK